MSIPLVIAHRGNSSQALENSLEAFRLAMSIPVDMIELDVRMTRDKRLFVMHDNSTRRTADRDLLIEHSMADDVSCLILRNGEAIPGLIDVLNLVNGAVGINLEIKSDGAGTLVAAKLAEVKYFARVLLSSFNMSEVLAAKEVLPDVPIAGIFDRFSPRRVSEYRARGFQTISLNRRTVTRNLIDRCHAKDIRVYIWTVDKPDQMQKFISWGADGIYSNKPALLKMVLDRSQGITSNNMEMTRMPYGQ